MKAFIAYDCLVLSSLHGRILNHFWLAQRDAVCHSECLPEAGCWGPTADMCAHCCNRKAGDFCVSECTDRPGYYEVRRSQSQPSTKQPTTAGTCPTLAREAYSSTDLTADLAREWLPPQECSRCHEECEHTCYGPGPHECQGGCRHFQVSRNIIFQCVLAYSQSYHNIILNATRDNVGRGLALILNKKN